MSDAGSVLEEIDGLFVRRGEDRYSEAVSQREHALQCALQAAESGGASALVAAALLHDIGHMLHKFGGEPAARGIDDRHEDIGAGWLAKRFGPAVTEPVRLHVDAKRYLCAVEPGYFATLSPASVCSLALQGGPMDAREAEAFEAGAHFRAAVGLRRWDEGAKVPGAPTPSLDHFLAHIAACLDT